MTHGISMFSFAGDRRQGGVDRRLTPRGGRRIDDKIRLALYTACALLVVPGEKAPQ